VSSITPVDANHLTAKVQPSASAAAGPRTVTLTNPDGGRGTCAGCFTVDLAPVVSGIDPPAVGQGGTRLVTLSGSGFLPGMGLDPISGVSVGTVTVLDGSHATASLTVAPTATVGTRSPVVRNTDGGSATCSTCLSVTVRPKLSYVTPKTRGQGAVNQTVTVVGANFVAGATATVGGDVVVNSVTVVDA